MRQLTSTLLSRLAIAAMGMANNLHYLFCQLKATAGPPIHGATTTEKASYDSVITGATNLKTFGQFNQIGDTPSARPQEVGRLVNSAFGVDRVARFSANKSTGIVDTLRRAIGSMRAATGQLLDDMIKTTFAAVGRGSGVQYAYSATPARC